VRPADRGPLGIGSKPQIGRCCKLICGGAISNEGLFSELERHRRMLVLSNGRVQRRFVLDNVSWRQTNVVLAEPQGYHQD
jgi:hypothetical protein